MAFHVICWQGPEWCEPQLVVEGSAKKAQKVADEMNGSEEAKLGLQFPDLSRFVVKKNIRKVTV